MRLPPEPLRCLKDMKLLSAFPPVNVIEGDN
jgi:hypothetical protein